jgi:hypothetical protein
MKSLYYFALSTLLIVLLASCQEKKKIFKIPDGHVGMFGYERFEETDLIKDYNIDGGPVYAYRALPDFVAAPNSDIKQNIIERSYSNIIQDAFDYWGKGFEEEYKKSTEPFDTTIIKENQRSIWINPPLDKVKELKSIFK